MPFVFIYITSRQILGFLILVTLTNN